MQTSVTRPKIRRPEGLIALLCCAPLLALPPVAQSEVAPSQDAATLIERGKRAEHGVGAPQDLGRAIQFYCQAAALDAAEAQFRLGWLYLSGRTGKIDEVLAASWLQAAAAQDNAWAKQALHKLGTAESLASLPAPACVRPSEMIARRLPQPRPTPAAQPDEQARPKAPGVVVRQLARPDIIALVHRLAPEYELEPQLVLAVIEVESNFDPQARSPKNAQGLMQLIPATAARFGVKNPWDPLDNLRGGMAYLRWLLDQFDGDLELALAGYNAGENAVKRHGGIPPYPETQAYVQRITRLLRS